MTNKLNESLQRVEMTYAELIEIANAMTASQFGPINSLVQNISNSVNSMSIDQIRDSILSLQLKAFEISEIKEKSSLKAELAEALQKEQFAIKFSGSDGSAAVKDKLATIATSEETLSEIVYNLVANMYKNKVDSIHRLVDALKSVLMSRMQETKFMNIGASSEIAGTQRCNVVLDNGAEASTKIHLYEQY